VYNEQLLLHLQERTLKNERDLRSLKKRLDEYDSAKEAIFDPFFTDLFVESDLMA
jgi:serine/threonine-protein kinase haspin